MFRGRWAQGDTVTFTQMNAAPGLSLLRRPGDDVSVASETGLVSFRPFGKEAIMLWAIGIGGFFLYLLVAFTLGLMTLRNGHGWMFFFGIFFPILWIFGAFMRPPETTAAAL
jgi:hypothetical protein